MAEFRRKFEEKFLRYLEDVTKECDSFIGREKIKCRPKGSGGVTTRMPPDIQETYEKLQVEHDKLVHDAEEKADESLSISRDLTRKALDIEEQLEGFRQRYRFEFPGEEVCETCGVRYALQGGDNPEWHEKTSHLNGKMHHGWLQIRQKLQELRQKERVWERDDCQKQREKGQLKTKQKDNKKPPGKKRVSSSERSSAPRKKHHSKRSKRSMDSKEKVKQRKSERKHKRKKKTSTSSDSSEAQSRQTQSVDSEEELTKSRKMRKGKGGTVKRTILFGAFCWFNFQKWLTTQAFLIEKEYLFFSPSCLPLKDDRTVSYSLLE